jgi:hypothetical protein
VRTALGFLLSGEAKTQREAAEKAGIHPVNLSKALNKPGAKALILQDVRERLTTIGLLRAAATLESLLHTANSEHVRLEAAKFVLGASGVDASRERLTPAGGITLNINLPRLGQRIVMGSTQAIESEAKDGDHAIN